MGATVLKTGRLCSIGIALLFAGGCDEEALEVEWGSAEKVMPKSSAGEKYDGLGDEFNEELLDLIVENLVQKEVL